MAELISSLNLSHENMGDCVTSNQKKGEGGNYPERLLSMRGSQSDPD